MKLITLCADDFGYNAAISHSIAALATQRRLSATCCMTNMPYWPKAVELLQDIKDTLDIGLHLNLTEGKALYLPATNQFNPLRKLLFLAFTHQLDVTLIANEIRCQLDCFFKATGRLPDFIDGHEHVHHLPVIREALLTVYEEYYPAHQAYIRIASNPFNEALRQSLRCKKIIIIALTGALALKRKLIDLNIPHNNSFSGTYSLNPKENYAALFKNFIKEISRQGIIMCHPGKQSDPYLDSIALARQQEYAFFNSDYFSTILTTIKLTRLKN